MSKDAADIAMMLGGMGFSLYEKIDGETSDGYHTFNELYDQRDTLFLSLVEVLLSHGEEFDVFKSTVHQDGTFYQDYFLLLLVSRVDHRQVSFHLKVDPYWKMAPGTDMSLDYENLPVFDGHDSVEALARLRDWFLNTYDRVEIDYGESTEDSHGD